jgi:protein-disulfide isomerase
VPRVVRLVILAALSAASAALLGCVGDPPSLSALSNGVSSDDTPAGSAYPDASGAKDANPSFNPLAEQAATTPGGRQVIDTPTLADIMLTGRLPEMSLGRANAPVTIVQYASLTCPHCRRFHLETFPDFKRVYIDTGKVRYVLREFPIGKTSGNATIALRCAPPERYFDLYGEFMEQQARWVSQEVRLDAIYDVAKQVGMTRAQFDGCLKNQGMIDALKWVKERGRTLGVIGTPNFFIGSKLVKSTPSIGELRELIEPMLKAPTTASAGSPAQ